MSRLSLIIALAFSLASSALAYTEGKFECVSGRMITLTKTSLHDLPYVEWTMPGSERTLRGIGTVATDLDGGEVIYLGQWIVMAFVNDEPRGCHKVEDAVPKQIAKILCRKESPTAKSELTFATSPLGLQIHTVSVGRAFTTVYVGEKSICNEAIASSSECALHESQDTPAAGDYSARISCVGGQSAEVTFVAASGTTRFQCTKSTGQRQQRTHDGCVLNP